MKRMGLIQQKRPLYHQLIALLCIPPMGAGLVFFFYPFITHSLLSPFPFLLHAPSLPFLLLYPLHNLSNRACQRFSHSQLSLCFLSVTALSISFSIAQLKCVLTLQPLAGANLCLFSLGRSSARGGCFVCVAAELYLHVNVKMTTTQNVSASLSQRALCVPVSV